MKIAARWVVLTSSLAAACMPVGEDSGSAPASPGARCSSAEPVLRESAIVVTREDLARIAPCKRIEGALRIAVQGPEPVVIPELSVVEGPLAIQGSAAESFTLPRLTVVNGNFSVEGNAALRTLELPALESVQGALRVGDPHAQLETSNPSLTTLELPVLASVGLGVVVSNNALLESFALSFQVSSSVELSHNPRLRSVSLEDTQSSTSVFLVDNPVLDELSVRVPPGAALTLEGPSALEVLDLSQSPLLSLHATRNTRLREIRLGTAQSMQFVDTVVIRNNEALELLELDAMFNVNVLEVRGTSLLTRLHLPGTQSVGTLLLDDNPGLADLSLPAVSNAFVVTIRGAPSLPGCVVRTLRDRLGCSPQAWDAWGLLADDCTSDVAGTDGALHPDGVPLDALDGTFVVDSLDDMAQFQGIQCLRGALFVHGVMAEMLDFPDLGWVQGPLEVTDSPRLATVRMPRLMNASSLVVSRNAQLTGLEAGALRFPGYPFEISFNPMLPDCVVEALWRRVQPGCGCSVTLGGNLMDACSPVDLQGP